MAIADERCVPCRRGTRPLTRARLAALRREVPGWRVRARGGVCRLERAFAFPDFAAALAFVDRVGALAEAQAHHPVIRLAWGRVTVAWWTHAIGGLHRNDVIMAARTDRLVMPPGPPGARAAP